MLVSAEVNTLHNSQKLSLIMEITTTSTETIKPSTPTPQHLRHLKLSLIDQYMKRTVYTHVILFYSARGDVNRFCTTNTSGRLKSSLSEALTEFYPAAGTFMHNQYIECNDEGLEYVEARVKAPFSLDRLMSSPRSEELNRLLPYNPCKYGTEFDGKLSAVKVTVFEECGGMAVGVGLSHAIADGSSLAMFVNRWAAIARGEAPTTISPPEFGFGSSLFPPRDHLPVLQITDFTGEAGTMKPQPKLVTKRFVFGQMNIDAITANFHASQRPTRVVAVSALIFKCLINVAKATSSKPVALCMAVNIRRRMTPPLPVQYFGNTALPWDIEHAEQTSLCDLGELIRRSIKEVDSDYIEKQQADGALLLFEMFQQRMEQFMNGYVRVFGLTSFCRFPFSEADVGWGEPAWAVSFFPNCPDGVTLVDAMSGGAIEAWVTLDEDDMARFESDGALLEFTSPK